jgi:hypothetical protein
MTTTWHPIERLRLVRPRVRAPRLNPLQVIAPTVGGLALLGGLVAIGHSGFHAEHVVSPHDALAGIHYTPLLAACALGFGLSMLVGAELVRFGRSRIRAVGDLALGLGTVVLTVAGGAALGLGIVVLAGAWPSQLLHWLNIDRTGGVTAVVVGSAGLVAAITAPLIARRTPAEALAPTTTREGPPAPPPRPPASDADPTLQTEKKAS